MAYYFALKKRREDTLYTRGSAPRSRLCRQPNALGVAVPVRSLSAKNKRNNLSSSQNRNMPKDDSGLRPEGCRSKSLRVLSAVAQPGEGQPSAADSPKAVLGRAVPIFTVLPPAAANRYGAQPKSPSDMKSASGLLGAEPRVCGEALGGYATHNWLLPRIAEPVQPNIFRVFFFFHHHVNLC